MSRREFLAAAATTGLAVVVGHGASAAYDFEVERALARIPRLRRPVRLAFLTDLHFGPYVRTGSVAAWVAATLASAPDLIVLGGDLVDAMGPADATPLVAALAPLRAPLGVYTVWGNHDHARARDLAAFERDLAGAGIDVLRNRGVDVRDDLHLAGIDDYREGQPDLAAALAGRRETTASILVSHNPDVLPGVGADVDVTLCGHTHGGQIRIPGLGPIVTSSRYGRRFVAGWVRGPARGYVSRGLGVGLVPLRIDCPAELTILECTP